MDIFGPRTPAEKAKRLREIITEADAIIAETGIENLQPHLPDTLRELMPRSYDILQGHDEPVVWNASPGADRFWVGLPTVVATGDDSGELAQLDAMLAAEQSGTLPDSDRRADGKADTPEGVPAPVKPHRRR